ncbi:DUF5008 domain-containing protein [Pedobacter sp. N36a]|uniref:DUF5008 domain-containing protein n=1 Tax=Pedobacter sp. N36a TaxID=2767996 RepID=UPI0016574A33|nr:DUF5008 domain-containing protein [Pedobacter sp. N36a]MBC8986303.1 DUF5008 domain-containing protein [Pedobacter sp. N36a]
MILIYIKQVKIKRLMLLLMVMATVTFSCKKKNGIGEDPYGGGKMPLGVSFADSGESAGSGVPGDQATIKVRGLLAYQGKFEFFINEIKTEVTSLTDSTLNIVVPANASSGGTTIVLDGQTFFGPKFTIEGKVSLDPTFKAKNGSNGTIADILLLQDGSYLLMGSFTNYQEKAAAAPINGIVKITKDGEFAAGLKAGKGTDGVLYTAIPLQSGKFMVGGSMNSFNGRLGASGITRLNGDGSLDTMVVDLINLTPLFPKNGLDTVPAFNGGVLGTVNRIYAVDNKIITVGRFVGYRSTFYERSTRLSKIVDFTPMNAFARMKLNGTLDSTYNFDKANKKGYPGVNGMIYESHMQPDHKIIAVGAFTNYNGSPAKNIVRVDTLGAFDPTFKTGSGADGDILSMVVNRVTGSIMISGLFKNYNGVPADGVAMLKSDGSIDPTFKFGALTGGFATHAIQLNSGKILVSGTFKTYNGIVRQGFMVLNGDGSLAANYNNTGVFEGSVFKVIETTSALGNPAVIMVGNIYKFDSQRVGNIVRIELK